MTASVDTLVARARAWQRGRSTAAGSQRGFILMLVLGAIGLTSVVIVALLGLAITSSRVTTVQREMAREQRAAASALESAIGQIGHSDVTEPCDALPADAADAQLVFEPNPDFAGVPIDVTCASVPVQSRSGPDDAPTQPERLTMSPAPSRGTQFAPVNLLTFECAFGLPGCDTTRTLTTTWSATRPDPIHSARLLIESDEGENIHNLHRNLVVSVTSTAGSCSLTVPGGRTNWWDGAFTSVDLFANAGCRTLLEGRPQSVFQGATITVAHRYVVPTGGCLPLCAARLSVSDVQLLTNVDTVQASSVSSAGAWSNSASVLTRDGTRSAIAQSGGCLGFPDPTDVRCVRAAPEETFRIEVAGFDVTGIDTLEPEDFIDSVGVVIDPVQNSPIRSWISDPIDQTSLAVELNVNGEDCTVAYDGFARANQQLYVELLDGGGCRELIQSVEDLASATLSYSVMTNCAHYPDPVTGAITRAPVSEGRCDSVRLPELDRIALAVTTVPNPLASLVTLTAQTPGGELVTQAEVVLDGQPTVPRPTPVVVWRNCRGGSGSCATAPATP